eukprot:gene13605-16086_t
MTICRNSKHLGLPRTLRVTFPLGSEIWEFIGEYHLLLDSVRPVWCKKSLSIICEPGIGTEICRTEESKRWMIRSKDQERVHLSLTDALTPEGTYEGNMSVTAEYPSNTFSLVTLLAFPCPKLDYNFYFTGGLGRIDRLNGIEYPSLLKSDHLVVLQTCDGERIPALHMRCTGARFTLIYSHGNAEDIGILLEEVGEIARHTRANVLAYEYVGYSLSGLEGHSPSEGGCYRSIEAAWRYLTADLSIAPDDIVLFGRSIGTGPTVGLASGIGKACAGVVLQSPLASGARVLLGDAALLLRPLESASYLQRLREQSVERAVATLRYAFPEGSAEVY